MKLLGIDLGSSFIKAEVVDGDTGSTLATTQFPDQEMSIDSKYPGWAEQDPEMWWEGVKIVIRKLIAETGNDIHAIGISYQMHGLILLDKKKQAIRESIIWCDSRSTSIGEQLFHQIGKQYCLTHFLNSPGNFTAAKWAWVKENEKDLYGKARYMMLPGDFIAMKLSGEVSTTVSGLSEAILWDFKENRLANEIIEQLGLSSELIPPIVDTFSDSILLNESAANELGLNAGIPISYRAGDQVNNALSLRVMEPGEVAATAGTSGVIYGITDTLEYDSRSRINIFSHVNHTEKNPRLGILLCINGTGILNRWTKDNFGWNNYESMNTAAKNILSGSEGIQVYPFGNGAERILENNMPGASFHNIDFNRHTKNHIARAVQEGIAFSLLYGLEIFTEMGVGVKNIRAGRSNMFLSPVFGEILSDVSQLPIQLYNMNGAKGAAIASGIGCGFYTGIGDAFANLEAESIINPNSNNSSIMDSYSKWKSKLPEMIETA